jgi:hypothetical protein
MKNRIWIVGLAVVLAGNCLILADQPTETSASVTGSETKSAVAARRPGGPLWQAVAESEGTYESASARNPEVLRRNVFHDIEVRDTLVYCLQGLQCGDSCASLMILNISDPSNPKFVSRLRFHGGADTGYDLRLYGDYVYLTVVAPRSNTWFYVIDVSNPLSPSIAGSYLITAYAVGIDVSGSLAFVTDGVGSEGSVYNMIRILNVADPAQITSVKDIPTNYILEHIRVRGNYAYAVGCYEMYTVDISEPENATVSSRFSTGLWPLDLDLLSNDSLIYIADFDVISPAYWSAFTIANVADPEQPKLVSQFPLFGAVLDVKVQGHWAYVSHGSCGLQVFDISNPSAPDSVARFEIPQFAGRMAIRDSLLLLPDIAGAGASSEGLSCYPPTIGPEDPQPGDLLILSIADPANPRLLGFYSPTEQDPTDVDDVEPELLPTTFTLYQNYPNPFNPGTVIEFDLPTRVEVQLTVYNLLGQEITRLVQSRSAGHHTIELNMKDQASGVYFYELRAGDYSGTGKMLLLK